MGLGITKATEEQFPNTLRNLCEVHLRRIIRKRVPRGQNPLTWIKNQKSIFQEIRSRARILAGKNRERKKYLKRRIPVLIERKINACRLANIACDPQGHIIPRGIPIPAKISEIQTRITQARQELYYLENRAPRWGRVCRLCTTRLNRLEKMAQSARGAALSAPRDLALFHKICHISDRDLRARKFNELADRLRNTNHRYAHPIYVTMNRYRDYLLTTAYPERAPNCKLFVTTNRVESINKKLNLLERIDRRHVWGDLFEDRLELFRFAHNFLPPLGSRDKTRCPVSRLKGTLYRNRRIERLFGPGASEVI